MMSADASAGGISAVFSIALAAAEAASAGLAAI
jgi:hypothetical protein